MATGGSSSGSAVAPFGATVSIRRSSFSRVEPFGRTSPGRGAGSGAMVSNSRRGLVAERSARISIRSSAWAVSRATISAMRPPATSTSAR